MAAKEVNGYQLREALKRWKVRKDVADKQFKDQIDFLDTLDMAPEQSLRIPPAEAGDQLPFLVLFLEERFHRGGELAVVGGWRRGGLVQDKKQRQQPGHLGTPS